MLSVMEGARGVVIFVIMFMRGDFMLDVVLVLDGSGCFVYLCRMCYSSKNLTRFAVLNDGEIFFAA